MSMQVYDHTQSEWAVAAERFLRNALDDVISGKDAIPAADAALAALRIEAGEMPADDDLLAGLRHGGNLSGSSKGGKAAGKK